MNIRASQKVGMDMKTNDMTVKRLSKTDPVFTADITPTGMEMRSINMNEMLVNSRVAGSLSNISSTTGLPDI